MEPLILLAAVGLIMWFPWGRQKLQISRASNALNSIQGFTCDFLIVGTDGVGLALDSARRYIAFFDKVDTWVYSFQEIVAVEICKNGISFTKTNRGVQLVSVLVGQALFGDKGFVVGGTTASRTISERVRKLSLKVYMNDLSQPVREIFFYDGSPLDVGGTRFRRCASAIDEWYGRIRAAMA